MATVRIPNSLQAQITRSAISPRFAIRIFLNIPCLDVIHSDFQIAKDLRALFPLEDFRAVTKVNRVRLVFEIIMIAAERRTIPARIQWAVHSPPAFSQFLRRRQIRSHSSASWLPQCTIPARSRPYPPASQRAAHLGKAPRKMFPRWVSAPCARVPPLPEEQQARREYLPPPGRHPCPGRQAAPLL